jgi:hypothetical protein
VIQATIGFIVFGVHKDGLKDPMGTPFVDDALVRRAKSALVAAGLKVIEHNIVIASKEEARAAFKKMNVTMPSMRSSYFQEPGFGQRTWSALFAITAQAAKACFCGRTPALKAGGPLADWCCMEVCSKSESGTNLFMEAWRKKTP